MSRSLGWRSVSIESIAAAEKWSLNGGPFGSKLVSSMYVAEGVPVIRGANLSADARFCDEGFVFVSADKARELRAHAARPGDVIFTQRGTLGQVGLIPPSANFSTYIVSQSQMKLTVDSRIADAAYVYYTFRCPGVVAEFVSRASSSGVPHVNLQTLRDFPIWLPHIGGQRRIASILSAYDDLIEVNQRRIAILEEMARRLFDEWFVRFRYPGHEAEEFVETELGRTPSRWSLGIVADCAQLISRGIAPTYDDGATGIVVNQKCIRDQRLSLEQARRQSKIVPDEKLLRYGDLVINSTGVGTLGRVAQVLVSHADTTVDSHVTIVRAVRNVDLQFFGLQILRLEPQFERQGVGSTGQTELSRKAIADTAILIPPQRLMVDFGRIVAPIRAQAELLRQQNTRLRAARDLLLPKLISGEIEIGRAEATFAVAAE